MSTITVPPIWYAGKRVARTIVQFLIVAVPMANLIAAALIEYLRNQEDVAIPAWVYLVLNGVLAATALIIGIVTRVMAIPSVNNALAHVGLGSVPADKVVMARNAKGTWASVLPDPRTSTREGYQDALKEHSGAAQEHSVVIELDAQSIERIRRNTDGMLVRLDDDRDDSGQ